MDFSKDQREMIEEWAFFQQALFDLNESTFNEVVAKSIQIWTNYRSFFERTLIFSFKSRPNQLVMFLKLFNALKPYHNQSLADIFQKYCNIYLDNDIKLILSINSKLERGEIIDSTRFSFFDDSSIEYQIQFDNISGLQRLTLSPDFNNNELRIMALGIRSNKITYLDLAAYFGSIECFRYLLLNNAIITKDTAKFAVQGGNIEIIELLRTKEVDFGVTVIKVVSTFRQNILEWIVDNYEVNTDDIILTAASANNIEAIMYYLEQGYEIFSNWVGLLFIIFYSFAFFSITLCCK